MIPVYIGLGSNLGQSQKQIQAACKDLSQLSETRLIKCSSLFQSLPMGPQNQPNYVNAVVLIETRLSPDCLLHQTQKIETQHGRIRKSDRWGPRTLDLDILLYGQQQLNEVNLTIPHIGMKQREFVLYPLSEIAPELILPCGEKLSDLVRACPKNGLQIMSELVLI